MTDKSATAKTDAVAFLTGSLSSQPWPSGISLPGDSGKFTSDGSVQIWPGNTFICHVDVNSASYNDMRTLQEDIKMSRFAPFFTFLPPSSFHMTVFEGVSPGVDDPALLPHGAAAGASRDQLNTTLLEKLEDIRFEPAHTVQMDSLFCANSLRVSRVGERGDSPLRTVRETLRAATGIHAPGFDNYTFHITLAYLLQWLSKPTAQALVDFSDELAERYRRRLSGITLGSVEFCSFDSMHHFEPLKRLV